MECVEVALEKSGYVLKETKKIVVCIGKILVDYRSVFIFTLKAHLLLSPQFNANFATIKQC